MLRPAVPLVLQLGAIDAQLPVTVVHGNDLLPHCVASAMISSIDGFLHGHHWPAGSAPPVGHAAVVAGKVKEWKHHLCLPDTHELGVVIC